MKSSPKPSHLQLLLAITLSLVTAGLVIWKLKSSRSGERDMADSDLPRASAETTPFGYRSGQSPQKLAKVPSISSDRPRNSPHESSGFSNNRIESSETKAAFQAARADLMRDHQQLIRSLVGASPEERQAAMTKWREEHAEVLAAQQQLAVQMGAESRPPTLRVPTPPRIPDNASLALKEFLTSRHAIMKDQAELMGQLQNATQEERHLAMEQWNEANSARIEAMQTATTRLSESQTTPHFPRK